MKPWLSPSRLTNGAIAVVINVDVTKIPTAITSGGLARVKQNSGGGDPGGAKHQDPRQTSMQDLVDRGPVRQALAPQRRRKGENGCKGWQPSGDNEPEWHRPQD